MVKQKARNVNHDGVGGGGSKESVGPDLTQRPRCDHLRHCGVINVDGLCFRRCAQ